MKIYRLSLGIGLLLFAGSLCGATNDPAVLLQKGLFEEEANHNLAAAIQEYQSLVNRLDEDRKLAATALFRLGECYRKQGRTNEAAAQYERVTRDFSDQTQLATLSRENLTGLGIAVLTAGGPGSAGLSNAARQEQKRLLEEEIKLVEKDVGDKQKMVETGTIGQDELRQKQRELLDLKRQLAALDEGTSTAPLQSDAELAAAASETQEIRRIQTMIKDSPDLINATDGGQSPLYNAAQKGQLKVAEFLLENGAAVSKEGAGGTPLHAAVKGGNKEIVELLLSHGANVNAGAPVPGRDSPLHLAASEGLKTICEILISHGADVNARAKNDYTPLHYAAQRGFKSIVELLLAHGADVNARDSNQATALSLAVQKRQVEVARVILSHKADPNLGTSSGTTPLHFVARDGPLAMAQLLLTNHADVNAKDNSGNTPLHEAASTGQPGIIEALLDYKADLNAKNREGATPLITAMAQKQWSAARLLIANKADLNFCCSPTINNSRQSDFYPIQVAMLVGSDELLELLLKNGSNPNAHTNQSVVPLAWAINAGRKDWADLLLKYKADPNLIFQRFPLLISAINQGRGEIVEAMLDHGADPNEPDPDGRAPLLRAVSVGNKDMVKALLDHKAEVNSAWRGSGDTPLHLAVSTAQKDVVELLLANGADPNLPNNEGKTPLMLTQSAGPMMVSAGPGTFVLPGAVPAPGQGVTYATRLQQLTNPNATPAPPTAEPPNEIRDLLLKHGATEDLPRLDRIQVRRPSTRFSTTLFGKGTNDWNQFTLFELIGVQYQLLALSPEQPQRFPGIPRPTWGNGLDYPDFARIRIRHPASDRKSWEERTIELSGPLSAGECSADVLLRWGDVVEIPEEDHPLNIQWQGPTDETLASLKKCLTRQIEVIVKGQSKKITLSPDSSVNVTTSGNQIVSRVLYHNTTFLIGPVLENSKLLLASSDLAHIKLKRTDPETKQPRAWTVDCSNPKNPPNLWLKDGDVINVPDKQ